MTLTAFHANEWRAVALLARPCLSKLVLHLEGEHHPYSIKLPQLLTSLTIRISNVLPLVGDLFSSPLPCFLRHFAVYFDTKSFFPTSAITSLLTASRTNLRSLYVWSRLLTSDLTTHLNVTHFPELKDLTLCIKEDGEMPTLMPFLTTHAHE